MLTTTAGGEFAYNFWNCTRQAYRLAKGDGYAADAGQSKGIGVWNYTVSGCWQHRAGPVCRIGSNGLEALSRGARYAIFNDRSRVCTDIIQGNIKTLGFEERARVYGLDFRGTIDVLAAAKQRVDIVFIDPPYLSGLNTRSSVPDISKRNSNRYRNSSGRAFAKVRYSSARLFRKAVNADIWKRSGINF